MPVFELAGWTQDMWSAIIGLFSFIPNWGFMIIVFTIVLKLILSPLDYFQRRIARKNAQKQALMQPELEKIQKKYGNNKQLLNQKTMELYKRENFSVMGSCLGMLLNMALTLFIFFTLFSGLTGMSNTEIRKQYESVETEYNQKFIEVFEITGTEEEQKTKIKQKEDNLFKIAVEEAQVELEVEETVFNSKVYSKALEIMYREDTSNDDYKKLRSVQDVVADKYDKEIRQGFLWVKNLWRPDTTSNVFIDFSTYKNVSNLFNSNEFKNELAPLIEGKSEEDIKTITKELKQTYENRFNIISHGINQKYKNTWNGYFILVVLAGVITYVSVKLSQMQSTKKKDKTKKDVVPQNKAMGFMKFMLPALMIIFTIGYSTAFSLYIVTNSIMSTLISFILLKIFERQEKKNNKPGTITISPAKNKNRPSYSREFLNEEQ